MILDSALIGLTILLVIAAVLLFLSVRHRREIIKEYNKTVKGVVDYDKAVSEIYDYTLTTCDELKKRDQETAALFLEHFAKTFYKRFKVEK